MKPKSSTTARVGIGPLESCGFGLAAALDLDAPQISCDFLRPCL